MTRRARALLAAVLVVAAGCGDDDGTVGDWYKEREGWAEQDPKGLAFSCEQWSIPASRDLMAAGNLRDYGISETLVEAWYDEHCPQVEP